MAGQDASGRAEPGRSDLAGGRRGIRRYVLVACAFAGLVEQEQEVNSRWIHNQDVISIPDTCPRLLNDIWVVAQALCVAPL